MSDLVRSPCETRRTVKTTPITGVYSCISATVDGKPLPADVVAQLRLTLTSDRYKTELGQQVLFESTYTLEMSQTPWKIDIIGIEGPAAGKAAQGICSMEDDTFTLCHTMPGQERPATFASPAESGVYLVVWVRKGE